MRSWFTSGRIPLAARAPVAVLSLPADHADYLRGRPRQALRTNVRHATAAGVTITALHDDAALRTAIDLLACRRGQAPTSMVPDRSALRLGGDRHVLLAQDQAGDPVGLCEVIVDGPWAGLGTLVTASGHPQAKPGRYLLHTETVRHLADLDVRYLTTHGSLLLASPGTRYFQQRTGYQPAWLRLG